MEGKPQLPVLFCINKLQSVVGQFAKFLSISCSDFFKYLFIVFFKTKSNHYLDLDYQNLFKKKRLLGTKLQLKFVCACCDILVVNL